MRSKIILFLSMLMTLIFLTSSLTFKSFAQSRDDHPGKDELVKVLMIGNSLTYSYKFNRTALKVLKGLAEGADRRLLVSAVAYDGITLGSYADENSVYGLRARNMILQNDWDYIILQQNTDYSMAAKEQTVADIMVLSEYINENCPQAHIMLNCTWAYDYVIVNEYDGRMWSYPRQRWGMRMTYERAAAYCGAAVIYSGDAFHDVKEYVNYPYQNDGNHPNLYGVFTNACCIYAMIFGNDPSDSAYTGELDAESAAAIKNIAYMHCAGYMGYAHPGPWAYRYGLICVPYRMKQ